MLQTAVEQHSIKAAAHESYLLVTIGVSKFPTTTTPCVRRRFKSFCSRVPELSKRRRTQGGWGGGGGTCLRQWSRVNFCLADSFRVRQALCHENLSAK